MKLFRRAGLALVAAVLSTGAVGLTAPAHADTQWPCGGCLSVYR